MLLEFKKKEKKLIISLEIKELKEKIINNLREKGSEMM